MTKDIITFYLSDNLFAADLQKVPLILKADKFLPPDLFFGDKIDAFKYGRIDIHIINMYDILKLVPKELNNNSRILIGEEDDFHYGIIVEKVLDIINLNGNHKNYKIPNPTVSDYYFEGILEIEDQQFILLNLSRLFQKIKTNIINT